MKPAIPLKHRLIDKPEEYQSSEDSMTGFYNKKTRRFNIMFNGVVIATYKSPGGYTNKRNELIEKYKLVKA